MLLADVLIARLDLPLGVQGLVDESGHLATAGLALLAAARLGLRLPPVLAAVVLAASVLIDADHVPLYAGLPVEGAGGRPLTHGLWLPALLLLLALLRTRARPVLLAVAAGLALHQLRDSATGPGLPWLWPVGGALRAPYAAYLAVLVVAAVTALAPRQAEGSSPPRRR